jgi:hypothetical protein
MQNKLQQTHSRWVKVYHILSFPRQYLVQHASYVLKGPPPVQGLCVLLSGPQAGLSKV